MNCNIIVQLQFEAVHLWPDCTIKEVMFLAHKHRHIFHVKAKKNVSHDNRDVEIIMLKREIESYIKEKYNGDLGSMSCEMVAKELMEKFGLCYCSVLEDNENGAEYYL